MSDSLHDPAGRPGDGPTVLPVDARQGKTGMGVRYVLAISMGAAIVVLGLIYLLGGF